MGSRHVHVNSLGSSSPKALHPPSDAPGANSPAEAPARDRIRLRASLVVPTLNWPASHGTRACGRNSPRVFSREPLGENPGRAGDAPSGHCPVFSLEKEIPRFPTLGIQAERASARGGGHPRRRRAANARPRTCGVAPAASRSTGRARPPAGLKAAPQVAVPEKEHERAGDNQQGRRVVHRVAAQAQAAGRERKIRRGPRNERVHDSVLSFAGAADSGPLSAPAWLSSGFFSGSFALTSFSRGMVSASVT